MELINRIKVEKFYNKESKAREIKEVISQIEKADSIYHFIRTYDVYVHGYRDNFSNYYEALKNWESYTGISRRILIDEVNHCIDSLNGYLKYKYEPDVTIRYTKGNRAGEVVTVKESTYDLLSSCGLAEIVE